RPSIARKNDLFFHRFRPANSTYLFGFRKHEQGQNAKEMAEFEPVIAGADAAIDQVKRSEGANATSPIIIEVSQSAQGADYSVQSKKVGSSAEAVEEVRRLRGTATAKPVH